MTGSVMLRVRRRRPDGVTAPRDPRHLWERLIAPNLCRLGALTPEGDALVPEPLICLQALILETSEIH
jgi:hypothetical protein